MLATMLSSKVVDRLEQALALVLYIFFVQRIWPEKLSVDDLAPALILVSEGFVIVFILVRRTTAAISVRPQDWIAALAGTTAPLLVDKVDKTVAPGFLEVGVFLLLFGMVTQVSAKLSLRRSFGLVAANRGVKTGGAYRYVRHPMYLGYMISHVGFLLLAPTLWNLSVYAICWTCLILRVRFEERLLSEDPSYQAFKERVRHRLLPGVY